jgi:hypothetical protein
MATRLTVDEFFDALHAQGIQPLIDTPASREVVTVLVKQLCTHYPIQGRWPVLDLETAYEGMLNSRSDLLDLWKQGYKGTINLSGYDQTYSLDEWFDDFRRAYKLEDTTRVRATMQGKLPPGTSWAASSLYQAYKHATRPTMGRVLRSFW